MSGGTRVTVDKLGDILKAVEELTKSDVLVGVPAEKVGRRGDGEPINNAGLAYLHEHGVPEKNIPARPFLYPGVAAVRGKSIAMLKKGAEKALSGDVAVVKKTLNAVGVLATNSVRDTLIRGEGFAELSEATLAARARRGRKGAKEALDARKEGRTPEGETARPLFDTGQMARSITYIVKPKGQSNGAA